MKNGDAILRVSPLTYPVIQKNNKEAITWKMRPILPFNGT